MNKRIILYGNGSAGNHGCEAIVRGTVEVLGYNNKYIIQSDAPDEDIQYGLSDLAEITTAVSKRAYNLQFLSAYAKLKLTGNYVDMDGLYYLPGIEKLKRKADVALSVGGDNYCYGGTGIYAYLNRTYHKQGIKTVLWGCSIEPDVVKQADVAKDLADYDGIITRESITYEAVREVQKNCHLSPDPAFFMLPKQCEIDSRFGMTDVIGLNVSPMIISNESKAGITYENYKQLISYILKETDASIALIPHVVWNRNDDHTVLNELYNDFDQNKRLILVEDHTAPELKYIISKCSFFIGARTHATIAAYSSCVPTLVVGYSVKARGIARDIFGNEEGYVLPVQHLSAPSDLTNAFVKLYDKQKSIKDHLTSFIPEYCSRGHILPSIIEDIINK